MADVKEIAKGIRNILIDCDGVLTDGKLYIDHDGRKSFKAFHTRDVRAIRELVSLGFAVHIITADDWPGSFHFAEKTGAEVIVSRDKKLDASKYSPYIAIGDDAWDVGMLLNARIAFAPGDCDFSVLDLCLPPSSYLKTKAGQGVVAEMLRVLCRQ